MKKTIALILLLLTFACNPTEFKNKPGELQASPEGKWKVNQATAEGIATMKLLTENFSESEKTIGNYNTLGKNMHTAMKEIFKKCDMTGDAHEELHDYLLPMLGSIRKLKEDDLEKAQLGLAEMEELLKLFEQYFE